MRDSLRHRACGMLRVGQPKISLHGQLAFGEFVVKSLAASVVVGVNARTRDATAFASHDFQELNGRFAGLAIGFEQVDIFLVEGRNLLSGKFKRTVDVFA